MFLVKAKETTVVIGERVFSPVLATSFDELPPEFAERSDLLHIEEVADEDLVAAPGGLTATGTLGDGPGEDGAGAGGAPDDDDQGQGADELTRGQGQGEGAGAVDDPDGTQGGDDAAGTAPTVLTDEALMNGVAVLRVGDDEDDDEGDGGANRPGPFADPANTQPPAGQAEGTTTPPAPPKRGGGGNGGRGRGARS